jgi:hypothetical protein
MYNIQGEWIELTSGKYTGVIYKYGRVQFSILNEKTSNESLKCSFQYNLHPKSKEVKETSNFISHIGQILMKLIDQGLIDNSIIYTGGSDNEVRTEIID